MPTSNAMTATRNGDPAAAQFDDVVQGLYAQISGPAGQVPDWASQGEYFAPGARLYIAHPAADGSAALEALTPDEYRATRDAFLTAHAFYEVEVSREVQVRGSTAHVLSGYETRESPDGPATSSGTNHLLLARSGGRWWVTSMLWESSVRSGTIQRAPVPLPTGERPRP